MHFPMLIKLTSVSGYYIVKLKICLSYIILFLNLVKSSFNPKHKTGNVELTNMQLKPEALNALKLPVKVKAGFLGSVKLKVCWVSVSQGQYISFFEV